MNEPLRQSGRERPLVALVTSLPLVGESLAGAIDFADVQAFAADGGEIAGLLRWLRPDAVIVDAEADADGAAAFALEQPLPVLHVSLVERTLRLFHQGHWEEIEDEPSEPETVRNVLAGALFAGGRA